MHKLAEGVTVTIAFIGVVPLLVAENEEIFPEPAATKPIDGFVFAQSKLVLKTVLVNEEAAINPPEQTVELGITLTVGIGFTNTVKLVGVPIHKLADGVTVMTPEIPAALEFVAP